MVKTTHEAAALLAWRKHCQNTADGPLRIWPVDNLRHKDISAQQRHATASFPKGSPYAHLLSIPLIDKKSLTGSDQ